MAGCALSFSSHLFAWYSSHRCNSPSLRRSAQPSPPPPLGANSLSKPRRSPGSEATLLVADSFGGELRMLDYLAHHASDGRESVRSPSPVTVRRPGFRIPNPIQTILFSIPSIHSFHTPSFFF